MPINQMARPGGPAGRAGWRVVVYLFGCLVVVDATLMMAARRWRAYDPVVYRERIRHCRGHAWDLVVVGGSPAMCGVDVDVLAGLRRYGRRLDRVYNLGLPLATTGEVELAVQCGLSQPPTLLVYGITATDLNDARVEPQGPRYLMRSRDVARWVQQRPKDAWWCVRHSLEGNLPRHWHLLYYRDGVQNWLADTLDHHYPGLCDRAAARARDQLQLSQRLREPAGLVARGPAGASARLDCLKAAGAALPAFPFLDGYHLDHYVRRLYCLLGWAAAHGVEIILVDLPVPPDLDQSLHPYEFAAYRAVLVELEQTGRVRVLRATPQAVGLTDADFSDLIHLNGDGARRLSTWLRHQLEDS